MLPQTVIPLLYAPKDVAFPLRAKEYVFGEFAEAQLTLRALRGKTFKLGAPLSLKSSKTLDELIDIANGPVPRGAACGMNLCRNAITEMVGNYRCAPDKLYYLYYFRPPLPEWDHSFDGGGGQDGRKDWCGKDVPEISGMCYTSDHKVWLSCGVSPEELIRRGWTAPQWSYTRNSGDILHEILHACGLPHTEDDPISPVDERWDSIMHNYFNWPQKHAHDNPWLTPDVAEGARWISVLDSEWAKVVSIGGLS